MVVHVGARKSHENPLMSSNACSNEIGRFDEILLMMYIMYGSNTECLPLDSDNSTYFWQLTQASIHKQNTTKLSFGRTDC